ncbi:MAG TPA: hypothetical protein VHA37_10285 [Candidatus Saccharimonadales bacterium]|nr:hypothetical protein [Candidatus Saccharimonadales bacterium]
MIPLFDRMRPPLRRKLAVLGVVLVFTMVSAAGMVGISSVSAAPATPAASTAGSLAAPVSTFAAAGGCSRSFFGLRAWYYYMPDELGVPKRGDTPADPCAVRCFNVFPQKQENDCGVKSSDIPAIILAVVDDLLRIAGLVAVIFVIIGSFEFIGSRGNSEKTASAQSTVIGALIGLAISMAAVGFIAFIGNKLGS